MSPLPGQLGCLPPLEQLRQSREPARLPGRGHTAHCRASCLAGGLPRPHAAPAGGRLRSLTHRCPAAAEEDRRPGVRRLRQRAAVTCRPPGGISTSRPGAGREIQEDERMDMCSGGTLGP